MDRLLKIIFTGLILLCSGCTTVHPGYEVETVNESGASEINNKCYQAQSGQTIICDEERGYTYMQPDWIIKTDWKERSVNVKTFDFPLSNEELEEWKTYGHYLPVNASCSPIITGSKEIKDMPQERGTAAWGKVDYTDIYYSLDHAVDQPRPLCTDSTPFTGSYSFCSEYEGKTVVICIDQKTDNPTMAEDIFRTFRWLP